MLAQIKAILITGVQSKLDRGESLEDILAAYVKLTTAEKDEIRKHFGS
jgi:hypothetical protein